MISKTNSPKSKSSQRNYQPKRVVYGSPLGYRTNQTPTAQHFDNLSKKVTPQKPLRRSYSQKKALTPSGKEINIKERKIHNLTGIESDEAEYESKIRDSGVECLSREKGRSLNMRGGIWRLQDQSTKAKTNINTNSNINTNNANTGYMYERNKRRKEGYYSYIKNREEKILPHINISRERINKESKNMEILKAYGRSQMYKRKPGGSERDHITNNITSANINKSEIMTKTYTTGLFGSGHNSCTPTNKLTSFHFTTLDSSNVPTNIPSPRAPLIASTKHNKKRPKSSHLPPRKKKIYPPNNNQVILTYQHTPNIFTYQKTSFVI